MPETLTMRDGVVRTGYHSGNDPFHMTAINESQNTITFAFFAPLFGIRPGRHASVTRKLQKYSISCASEGITAMWSPLQATTPSACPIAQIAINGKQHRKLETIVHVHQKRNSSGD
ncbi:MAG: hypothetical protein AAGF27_02605 [Pseudomonadota bacterium]